MSNVDLKLASAARLTRVAQALSHGDADPADQRWLAEALQSYLSGGGAATIDAALGLRRGRGERSWRFSYAVRVRDELLRQTAERFFGHLTPIKRAEAIALGLRRYGASAWRTERLLDQCPARRTNRVEGLFWLMLKARPAVLSADRVARIIGPC